MARGFFGNALAPSRSALPLEPLCGLCQLDKKCNKPKMPVWGQGGRKILVVGEAPGEQEDLHGIPFYHGAPAGGLLHRTLTELGVDLEADCWVTNSVICRPPRNELPEKAIDYCRPNLVKAVTNLQPEVIILLGTPAVRSLLSWLWKGGVGSGEAKGGKGKKGDRKVGGIMRWAGWQIPSQKINAWICPTYHPSFINRAVDEKKNDPVPGVLFKRHLKNALKKSGRPWLQVPDYRSQVTVEVKPDLAAKAIVALTKQALASQQPVAFDYETTTLKPEGPHAEIWTCSISDGATTIAYPWQGDAIRATCDFLRSPIPKIASNVKFEERWSLAQLDFGVNNWWRDTMQDAHVLDNRPEIASIKFQAFVLLGQDDWEAAVKPYLRASTPNAPNRIKDCDLRTLLVYNGMDSLLEWHVAMKQAKKLGVV